MEKKKDRTEAHSDWSSTATAAAGGLPLVPCPKCDAEMIWAVSGSSKNREKEYYKCARNDGIYSGGCDTFMWKDQYLRHLIGMQRRGESPVKLSNANEVVFKFDHSVLEQFAGMRTSLEQIKTSLDEMNYSVKKSTAGVEKLKFVVVAFVFLMLGILLSSKSCVM